MRLVLASALSMAALISSPPALAEKCHGDLEFFYEPQATRLSAEQKTELQTLVERFRQRTRVEALIFVGHADSTEGSSEAMLQGLALQRAIQARDFLARVYPDLTPKLFAESKAASQPDSEARPERNRRTEFMLLCITVRKD